MRIVADREKCMGAGQCVLTSPELFDQSDEDGRVLLRSDTVPAGQADAARLAVKLCPMHVLSADEE
jgi:ferredoxin